MVNRSGGQLDLVSHSSSTSTSQRDPRIVLQEWTRSSLKDNAVKYHRPAQGAWQARLGRGRVNFCL